MKIMTVIGTRPEGIKMAPVIKLLAQDPALKSVVVTTGQHREMLQTVFKVFDFKPDYDLKIMAPNQTLTQITSRVLLGMERVLQQEKPDLILVHGDTSTTMAASLSAFYHQIPIGHVEAGLRTWDKYSPYPEEMNRQLTDDLADLYFAPTKLSQANLLKEHHQASRIFVTGNTAIDALQYTVQSDYHHDVLAKISPQQRIILLTMHRRENQGAPMQRVFEVIKKEVARHPDVEVIYPVHLSPKVQQTAQAVFKDEPRVHLIAPLDVVDFHNLAARSYLIMTDSGGVQEEAPSLNKPVLVLRDETERPEGVKAGTLRLVGTDPNRVAQAMEELLCDQTVYQKMAQAPNPYGDGHAAERIVAICKQFLNAKK
ncbi:non-hydrolyzing UDP-N-acetylglucosamine 2-epimerase [Limosilactobacillus allomucosae]|uniref:non-hydrolyzing UDP-N-acetylglucosamine 2-epimerase n=1 Tax=Limosilactobacillus allomucosae TaxID=3142938 RepID=UPI003267CB88